MIRTQNHSTLSPVTALFAVAFVTAFSVVAHSQETPKPAPEIQKLAVLAGSFDGPATYTIDGKAMNFTLHHVNRVVAGGFGVLCHEEADSPEIGHYESENLFGWDAGRGRLHLFSVTTDPNTHDHSGRWTDATHAFLRYEGLRDGKRLVEEIPFELVSPDEYRFKATVTVAGKKAETFEATMKGVSGMAGK